MTKRVIIANQSHAEKIEELRSLSYHNSKGFSVKSETELQNYCKWSPKDDSGIVLLVLNGENEAIACLRANVYHTSEIHEKNSKIFEGKSTNFVSYPTLDMTFAATNPAQYGGGFMSILRYYMYLLHRHSVKSITGHVVKGSILHTQLHKLGYEFLGTDYVTQYSSTVENWMLASLDSDSVGITIQILRSKYSQLISDYPLIINI